MKSALLAFVLCLASPLLAADVWIPENRPPLGYQDPSHRVWIPENSQVIYYREPQRCYRTLAFVRRTEVFPDGTRIILSEGWQYVTICEPLSFQCR